PPRRRSQGARRGARPRRGPRRPPRGGAPRRRLVPPPRDRRRGGAVLRLAQAGRQEEGARARVDLCGAIAGGQAAPLRSAPRGRDHRLAHRQAPRLEPPALVPRPAGRDLGVARWPYARGAREGASSAQGRAPEGARRVHRRARRDRRRGRGARSAVACREVYSGASAEHSQAMLSPLLRATLAVTLTLSMGRAEEAARPGTKTPAAAKVAAEKTAPPPPAVPPG